MFDRPPQPLDREDAPSPAAAVHADADALVLENLGDAGAGNLEVVIEVEDLGPPIAVTDFLEGILTEIRPQGVGQSPGEGLWLARPMVTLRGKCRAMDRLVSLLLA
jgi:hypothetical protein